MNRLVLKIILRLGRYAVLPVVALACAILAVWLLAMDRYTIAALVTAPIVFSIFLGAVALAIGLLLLPSRKHGDFHARPSSVSSSSLLISGRPNRSQPSLPASRVSMIRTRHIRLSPSGSPISAMAAFQRSRGFTAPLSISFSRGMQQKIFPPASTRNGGSKRRTESRSAGEPSSYPVKDCGGARRR